MKEFLLSSTLPYWLVFLLVIGGMAALLFQGRKGSKSNMPLFISAGCMLVATAFEILIYATVQNDCMWWSLSKEYGFWEKLLRLLPFAAFIVCQIGGIFIFKNVLEQMTGKALSLKFLFICFVLTFPIVFIISVGADIFGASDETKNSVSTIVFWILIIAGVAWSLVRNIMSVGLKQGIVFTVFSAVCVVAVCLAVFLFIVALISVFFQMLATMGCVVAIFFLFAKGKNGDMSLLDMLAKGTPSRPVFYDDEGHIHYNASARNSANSKIAERKRENNQ